MAGDGPARCFRRSAVGGDTAMRQAMFGFLMGAIFLAYASMAVIVLMR